MSRTSFVDLERGSTLYLYIF